MPSVAYEAAVELLAGIVVKSNLENVAQINSDDPVEGKKILADFANYGTDVETVSVILRELFADVGKLASTKQEMM